MERFFAEHGFHTFRILHNNCHFYGETALCGTRGWFYEETGSQKVFLRELIRLEASLRAAGEHEKICFLHYPPCYKGYICREIIELLERYRYQVLLRPSAWRKLRLASEGRAAGGIPLVSAII
jgi:predicted phosphohydrolase